MSGRRKYVGDFLIVGLAEAMFSLRAVVLIPVITRLLGKEAYGVWSMVIVTSMFLSPLLAARLPALMTRFFSGQKDDRAISQGFAGAMLVPLAVGVLLLAALWPLQGPASSLVFGDRQYASYVLPMAAYCIGQSLFTTIMSYFLVVGRQRSYAPMNLLWGLGEMALVALLATRLSLTTIITLLAGWQVMLALVVCAYVLARHGLAKPRLPGTREFWLFGGWLILSHAMFFWAGFGSRYILAAFGGVQTVAVFTVAYSVTQLVSLVTSPNVTALLPSISAHWNNRQPQQAQPLVSLAYKLVFLLGLPIVAGLYVYGNTLIEVLSPRGFTVPAWVLAMLALAPLSYGIFHIAAYAMWMEKKLHMAMVVQGIGVVVNVGLCTLLIGPLGIAGAVIGVVSAMLIMTAWMYRLSVGVFGIGIDWRHALRCLICASVMLGVLEAYALLPLPKWGSLLSGCALGAGVYLLAGILSGALPMYYVRQALAGLKRRLA